VEVHVHADVAHYLLNKKRREILKWEDEGGMTVALNGKTGVSPELLEVHGFDNNGHEVPMIVGAAAPPRAPDRREDRDERGDRDRDRSDRDRDRGDRDRGDRGGRGRDDRGGRGGRGRGRGR
jgi:ribonuclease E